MSGNGMQILDDFGRKQRQVLQEGIDKTAEYAAKTQTLNAAQKSLLSEKGMSGNAIAFTNLMKGLVEQDQLVTKSQRTFANLTNELRNFSSAIIAANAQMQQDLQLRNAGTDSLKKHSSALIKAQADQLNLTQAQRDELAQVAELNKAMDRLAAARAKASQAVRSLDTETAKLKASLGNSGGAAAALTGRMKSLDQVTASSRAALAALGAGFGIYTSATIAAAAATYGFITQLKQIISAGAEFSGEMARVNAVMGTNAEQLEVVKKVSLDLAASTQYTATEVAKAFREMGMSGMSYQESIGSIRAVLSLAAVGMMDFGQATDIATNVMFGFGIEAGGLSKVVDIMAHSVTNSNQEIKQLGDAMSYAAPVASSFGISLEMTAAMTEVLANSGIKASRAGTTLRRTFINLFSDTENASKAMAGLGVHVNTMAADMDQELLRVLKALNVATRGATENTGELAKTVGVYAAPGFMKLVAAAGASVDSLEELYKATKNAEGAAYSMQQKIQDTIGVDWRIFLSAIQSVQLEIFELMNGPLREMIQTWTAWVQGLAKDEERIKALGNTIVGILKTVGVLVAGIMAVSGLGLLAKGVEGAVKGFQVLRSGLTEAGKAATKFEKASAGVKLAVDSLAVGGTVAVFGQMAAGAVELSGVVPDVISSIRDLTQAQKVLTEVSGFGSLSKDNEPLAVQAAEIRRAIDLTQEQIKEEETKLKLWEEIKARGGDVNGQIAKITQTLKGLREQTQGLEGDFANASGKLLQMELAAKAIEKIKLDINIEEVQEQVAAAVANLELLRAKLLENSKRGLGSSVIKADASIRKEIELQKAALADLVEEFKGLASQMVDNAKANAILQQMSERYSATVTKSAVDVAASTEELKRQQEQYLELADSISKVRSGKLAEMAVSGATDAERLKITTATVERMQEAVTTLQMQGKEFTSLKAKEEELLRIKDTAKGLDEEQAVQLEVVKSKLYDIETARRNISDNQKEYVEAIGEQLKLQKEILETEIKQVEETGVLSYNLKEILDAYEKRKKVFDLSGGEEETANLVSYRAELEKIRELSSDPAMKEALTEQLALLVEMISWREAEHAQLLLIAAAISGLPAAQKKYTEKVTESASEVAQLAEANLKLSASLAEFFSGPQDISLYRTLKEEIQDVIGGAERLSTVFEEQRQGIVRASDGYSDMIGPVSQYGAAVKAATGWKDAEISRMEALLPIIDKEAKAYGVSREAILSMMHTESRFVDGLTSRAGAYGLMQIMPETMKDIADAFGVSVQDIRNNVELNIKAGVYYFSWLMGQFGDFEKAVRAYNAGIGRVQKGGGYSAETVAYVKKVMKETAELSSVQKSAVETSDKLADSAVDQSQAWEQVQQEAVGVAQELVALDSAQADLIVTMQDISNLEEEQVALMQMRSTLVSQMSDAYSKLSSGVQLNDQEIQLLNATMEQEQAVSKKVLEVMKLKERAYADLASRGTTARLEGELNIEQLEALADKYGLGNKALFEYNLALAELKRLQDEGIGTAEQHSKAIEQARLTYVGSKGPMAAYYASLKESIQSFEEVAVDAIDAFRSKLIDGLMEGKLALSDFFEFFKRKMLEFAVNTITVNIVGNLIGVGGLQGTVAAAAGAAGKGADAVSSAKGVGYLAQISKSLSGNSIGEGVAAGLGKAYTLFGGSSSSLASSGGVMNAARADLAGISNAGYLGAGAAGLAGGLVANQMFEGEYVSIGSTIGGAVGATAAPLIAAAIGMGPVGWLGLAGGAFLGALGGGGLGSLFGGEKETPKITLEVTGGDFRVQSTNGQWSVVDGGNGATANALNAINDEMQTLAANLGPGAEAALAAFQHTGQVLSSENFQQWVDDVRAGMIRAMAHGVRDDAIAEAGSGVLAGILTDALAQVGEDPQAMLAAVAGAKQLEKTLLATVEGIFNNVGGEVFDTRDLDLVSTRIYQLAHATMSAAEGIEGAMMRVMAGVDAGSTALKLVGDEMAGMSVQAIYDVGAALADAAGGYEELKAGMASYYDLFYTEEEKRANEIESAQRQTSRALEELGMTMPGTRDAFRELVESLDLTSASGQEAFAALTGLSPQFHTLYEEMEKAGDEVIDLTDQFLGLRTSLRDLADELDPQSSSANRASAESALSEAGYTGAFEPEAIAEFLRALANVDNAGGEAAEGILAVADALRAALDEAARVSDERAGLDLRLLELTGTETEYLAEVRRRELEGLDASNRAVQERIYALDDEAKALAEAARIADERAGLDLRLLELTGTQAEYVAAIRERELEGLDASNRAIQERIWALEDEAAMQRAATDLTIRLLELQGNSEAALALRRQQELDATQPGLHALLLRIYALEDEERALQALQDSANNAYATLERAVAAEREAIDASYQAQIDAIDAQRAATQNAYDAQREAMQGAHDAQMEAYQAQRDAAQEALSGAQAALSSIQSAISALEGQQDVSATAYAQAQADLSRYAKTGRLPEQDQLDRTLKTLGSIDQSDYASEVDYLAARGTTYANLLKLEKGAELQVDWAEATVNRLDDQIEIAQKQYDAQMVLMQAQHDALMDQYDVQAEAATEWRDAEMARLDMILGDAKAQLDVLMGIDTTLLSVEDALAQFLAEVSQTPPPAPPPGIETTQAAVSEQTAEQTAEIVALRAEIVLLRKDMAAIATAQVVPLKSLDDRMTKWDIDGIPPTRGGEDTEQTVVVLKAG
jgi:TP901 family phage tail tape measure protein